MTVATPSQRMAFIEREMERDRVLPLIDIAHHLYATYQAAAVGQQKQGERRARCLH